MEELIIKMSDGALQRMSELICKDLYSSLTDDEYCIKLAEIQEILNEIKYK